MNRQEFLKRTLIGLLPLALSPGAYAETKAPEDLSDWKQILQHALTSPSAHNIQPWKVKIISPVSIEVFFEGGKQLPYADNTGAFMVISMTLFCESVSKVARHFGFKTDIHYEHDPKLLSSTNSLVFFAGITISKEGLPGDNRVNDFYTRRTARFGYLNETVETKILSCLSSTVSDCGQKFFYTQEKSKLNDLLELNTKTLFDDLFDDKYRTEIKTWIRTKGEENISKDGLSATCLGQPDGLTKKFFAHNERFRSDFKRRLLKMQYENSLKNTNTVFWLEGEFSKHEDWILCGKTLLALWIELTEKNLYMQPFGNLVTNPSAYEGLAVRLKPENKIWLVGRIGYCKTPPASVRKTLTDILI